MVANEIDPYLMKIAKEGAQHAGVPIRWCSSDWRKLGLDLGQGTFDLLLLLGNSFCLLEGATARDQAAASIREIAAPGARVIIDERNFPYIVRERQAILAGYFRYRGQVLYCGTKVKGVPSAISENEVVFTYLDTDSHMCLGSLSMYPFGEGELEALFKRAGFEQREVYSDLESGYERTGDFYTHVFEAV